MENMASLIAYELTGGLENLRLKKKSGGRSANSSLSRRLVANN
jgi:hypothetical protein